MPEDILQASEEIAGQIKHSMTNGKIIMFTDVGIIFYILTLLCLIKALILMWTVFCMHQGTPDNSHVQFSDGKK